MRSRRAIADSPRKPVPSAGFRCLLAVLVLAGIAVLFSFPLDAFRVGRHRLAAETHFREQRFGLAKRRLDLALAIRPRDERLHRARGEASYEIARRMPDAESARRPLTEARNAFQKASALCPLDASAAYGLARAEAWLAFLIPRTRGNPIPAPDPVARFRRALSLRPHGVTYRYAFIRYLQAAGRSDLLADEVRRLAFAYPPAVRSLARERFWNPALRETGLAGVRDALAAGVAPRESHAVLSALYEEKEDWVAALDHRRAAMDIQEFRNSEGDYLALGHLCLRNGEIGGARDAFDRAFREASNRGPTLRRVFFAYRQAGKLDAFAEYAESLNRFFTFSNEPGLLRGRALAESGRRVEARNWLERLGRETNEPEAFGQLARMAMEDKDWDAMELAAQQASALTPGKTRYRVLLSVSLWRQGKLDRAESELTEAIRTQAVPSHDLLHRRALIRWQKEAFAAALEDWCAAIRLRPDREVYRQYADRARERLESRRKAAISGPVSERSMDGRRTLAHRGNTMQELHEKK